VRPLVSLAIIMHRWRRAKGSRDSAYCSITSERLTPNVPNGPHLDATPHGRELRFAVVG